MKNFAFRADSGGHAREASWAGGVETGGAGLQLSQDAQDVAAYLDTGGGLAVPQDVGVVPAEALHTFTTRLSAA